MHLVGSAAVELEVTGQRDGVGTALLQRLADVERFEPRELVDLLEHLAPDRREQTATLGRRQLAPLAVERALRGVDGRVDVGRGTARDARELRAVGRVLERERRAARGAAPAAADQQLSGIEWNRRRRHIGLLGREMHRSFGP